MLNELIDGYIRNLKLYYSDEKSLTDVTEEDLNSLLNKIYEMNDTEQKQYFENEENNVYNLLSQNYLLLKKELLINKNAQNTDLINSFIKCSDSVFNVLREFLGLKYLLFCKKVSDCVLNDNENKFNKFGEMLWRAEVQKKNLESILSQIKVSLNEV
jgi:hypothetical protein